MRIEQTKESKEAPALGFINEAPKEKRGARNDVGRGVVSLRGQGQGQGQGDCELEAGKVNSFSELPW
jgi:hypothetical protein